MNATESLRDAVARAAQVLGAAGVTEPSVDAELLAAHVLGVGRGEVQAAAVRGDALPADRRAEFAEAVRRRAAREPLQHITGTAPFRHLVLRVGPGVFVPRPETEVVAQFAVDALQAAASPRPVAVDLGTGSGALALALATEVPHARVYAAEASEDALLWAQENIARWAPDNASAHRADFADAFGELDGTVSVVVSNPPYVPDDAIPRDVEVRLFDPPQALYGGPDGLDAIRVISRTALRLLHPGGVLVLEHGEWQGQGVRDVLTNDGWHAPATHPDLTMRDRATTATRP